MRHPSVTSFAFLNWAMSTTEPKFLSVNPPNFFCFFLDDLPLSSRFLGGSNKNTSGFVHSRVSPASVWCVTASFTLQGASQGQVACKMCNGMYEINLEYVCVTCVLHFFLSTKYLTSPASSNSLITVDSGEGELTQGKEDTWSGKFFRSSRTTLSGPTEKLNHRPQLSDISS